MFLASPSKQNLGRRLRSKLLWCSSSIHFLAHHLDDVTTSRCFSCAQKNRRDLAVWTNLHLARLFQVATSSGPCMDFVGKGADTWTVNTHRGRVLARARSCA